MSYLFIIIIIFRTDYYRIMKEKDEKMGFPPGIAAKIAYSVSNVQHNDNDDNNCN